MLKYIGITILACSVSLYGVKRSSQIMQSYRLKCEIANLLKEIERGIKYGGIPISVTLQKFSSPLLEKSGFLNEVRIGLDYGQAVEKYLQSLDTKDIEKLTEFFGNIGKSCHSERELQLCKNCTEYFDESLKNSEADTYAKALLCKRMGFIIAILAAIIFI